MSYNTADQFDLLDGIYPDDDLTEAKAVEIVKSILKNSNDNDVKEYSKLLVSKVCLNYTALYFINVTYQLCIIKRGKKSSYIAFSTSFKSISKQLSNELKIVQDKVRIPFDSRDDLLALSMITEDVFRELLDSYAAADDFGCCSRYAECSDAKHCIHPDKLRALSCTYRKRMKAGMIFCGKNRNID